MKTNEVGGSSSVQAAPRASLYLKRLVIINGRIIGSAGSSRRRAEKEQS